MEKSFVPQLAFDLLRQAEQHYNESGTFEDKDLEVLHSCFGEPFLLAAELLDKCRIIDYKLDGGLRNVYKIVSSKEQYTILDNINFCNCNVFRLQVLESRKAITCKHVLAVKLGIITGKVRLETVTGSQLVDFLNEQLNVLEASND
ncbi:unnamed protein product [Phyllotreta striolata]|uniref:SWIM-type domain-containing protein n=1 Tax=Phyllotreta striolata TaxID=444603 RepID=A0A9N9TV63_PHYSR|nr:unnamed protein product [Phyllotreta striolata]